MQNTQKIGAGIGLGALAWVVLYVFINLTGTGPVAALGTGDLRSLLAAGPWLMLGAGALAAARIPRSAAVLGAGVTLAALAGLALAGLPLPLLDDGAQILVARATSTWIVAGVLIAQGFARMRWGGASAS